jgi:hypothetical protein
MPEIGQKSSKFDVLTKSLLKSAENGQNLSKVMAI